MKKYLLIILLLNLFTTNLICAYPPDNAAVLYYKCMTHFSKPDKALWDEICELPTSTKPASEKAKRCCKDNSIIDELEVASKVENCDWGLDFSDGFTTLMPSLSYMKPFYSLILADGAIAAEEGDMDAALEKNLVVRRMAHHQSNEVMISYLAACVMVNKSDEALTHLLSTYSMDENTLVNLKRELLQTPYRPQPLREPLIGECNITVTEILNMTAERFKLHSFDISEEDQERAYNLLKNPPAGFPGSSIDYVKNYYDRILALLDKPYTEVIAGLEEEFRKVSEASDNGNDDALLSAALVRPLAKYYNYSPRRKTDYDALLTALDVYIATAQTGQLPEALPESTYIDHFSGKPFIYETTEDGFILRCRQEDLIDKEIREYPYSLPPRDQ